MTEPERGWRRLLVEPRRPEAVRNYARAPWLVVATVCTGAFIGQLDASIVTLAFPTLRHTFGASLASVQWVGQAYLLVLIGLLAAIGSYADMIGRKLLYTYGFVVFATGSALCGLAPNLGVLVAFRVLQGFGAAMLQANSVAIIVGAIPRDRLGRALGIQGAAQALGLALGPAVGGLLITLGGWRLIFFVNVPVAVAGAVLSWLLVPRSRDLVDRQPFDWPGLATFLPATAALLLALSYGERYGWGAPVIIVLFLGAGILTSLFIGRERRAVAPMLDLNLFSRWSFTAGVGSGMLSFIVLFGTLTVVPFLLEISRHESTGVAGVQLLAMPLALGLTAPYAGWLADRIGARRLTAGGMALAAGSLLASSFAKGNTSLFVLTLAFLGVGLGAFVAPNNAAIMGAAPRQRSGMASGALNMSRGLGTALGLALAGLAYTIGAGARTASPAQAESGYVVAARFLAVVAAVAAVIAALRAGGDEAATETSR